MGGGGKEKEPKIKNWRQKLTMQLISKTHVRNLTSNPFAEKIQKRKTLEKQTEITQLVCLNIVKSVFYPDGSDCHEHSHSSVHFTLWHFQLQHEMVLLSLYQILLQTLIMQQARKGSFQTHSASKNQCNNHILTVNSKSRTKQG